MKTLLRNDFKALLKSTKFRECFPEYRELFKLFDREKSCCRFPEVVYLECIRTVLKDLDKWKNYLGADKIQMYFAKEGEHKRAHIF